MARQWAAVMSPRHAPIGCTENADTRRRKYYTGIGGAYG